MAMLGLAPAAAAVGVHPNVPVMENATPFAFSGVAQGMHVMDSVSEVEYAKRKLEAFRHARKLGLKYDTDGLSLSYSIPFHIEGRRATSPAIKALLVNEYRERMREHDLEAHYQRALSISLLPQWVRSLL